MWLQNIVVSNFLQSHFLFGVPAAKGCVEEMITREANRFVLSMWEK